MRQELVVLYRQLADHTLLKCQQCRVPLSCCSPEYCQLAIEHARDSWQTTLTPTGHERLPLMGPTGCTAAPHLRPLCTYHTCKINSLGCDPADPEWTTTYFDVRDRIEEIEESLFDGS